MISMYLTLSNISTGLFINTFPGLRKSVTDFLHLLDYSLPESILTDYKENVAKKKTETKWCVQSLDGVNCRPVYSVTTR